MEPACSAKLTRRELLAKTAAGAAGLIMAGGLSVRHAEAATEGASSLVDGQHIFRLKEALYYEKLEHQRIKCVLCPRECTVADRERGFCGNRENRGGVYYTLVHGNPCAANPDPIEKKPFFHFLPGTLAFSISTAGCNFVCRYCQNWQISQRRPEQTRNVDMPPERVCELAERTGSTSIAYTYGEPVVFYEYMLDTAREGRKRGLKNVMVSNGYIKEKPMRQLCEVLDAVKIDFKGFTDHFYQETCRGKLKPVMQTLELLRDLGMWYELVYLMVPGLNDKSSELKEMAKWIVDTLGTDVPLHFSRFYPQYLLRNLPQTPISSLMAAREISMNAGIKFVYVGNVPGSEAANTYCPDCGRLLIRRIGNRVIENYLKEGHCKYCGESIPGVWQHEENRGPA